MLVAEFDYNPLGTKKTNVEHVAYYCLQSDFKAALDGTVMGISTPATAPNLIDVLGTVGTKFLRKLTLAEGAQPAPKKAAVAGTAGINYETHEVLLHLADNSAEGDLSGHILSNSRIVVILVNTGTTGTTGNGFVKAYGVDNGLVVTMTENPDDADSGKVFTCKSSDRAFESYAYTMLKTNKADTVAWLESAVI